MGEPAAVLEGASPLASPPYSVLSLGRCLAPRPHPVSLGLARLCSCWGWGWGLAQGLGRGLLLLSWTSSPCLCS